MGLLKDEALRLLREKWPNAQLLSEEVYAILNGDLPTGVDGPLTINNNGSDEPPIQLTDFGVGDVVLEATRDNGDGTDTVLQIGMDGSVTIADAGHGVGPAPEDFAEPELVGRGGVPCEVVEADGDLVTADLYENGTDRAVTRRVAATHWRLPGDPDLAAGVRTFAHRVARQQSSPITGRPVTDRSGRPVKEAAWYVQSVAASAAPTSTTLGRVVSGSGDTYSVELFGNGSGRAATATVTVTVPQIDDTETIPPGTWLSAVHKISYADPDTGETAVTYEAQPPVWLPDS